MKYLVAIPCMDMLHTPFVCSLIACRFFKQTEITFGANSLIYDTRNQLAEKAINEGFDRVLWFDSDMTFNPATAEMLSKRLDEGYEYVTGLYMTRKKVTRPCIFKEIKADPPTALFYDDYPKNEIFEIAASGFGGVMMTTDLIRRVGEEFGHPFSPILGMGEDLSFCYRVSQIGAKMYCDSSVKLGHIGYKEITEETYFERVRNEQTETDKNTEHGEG